MLNVVVGDNKQLSTILNQYSLSSMLFPSTVSVETPASRSQG